MRLGVLSSVCAVLFLVSCAGSTGPAGPAGPSGPQGPAGAKGADGAPGATGPEGPAGPTGPTGAAGATGQAGATGPTGPAGAIGATGPAGTFTGQFVGDAGVVGNFSVQGALVLVGQTAPASPADGTLYFDAASGTVKQAQGGTWYTLQRRPARTISGFTGTLGPDLSVEGYTQCYGWKNDGVAAPASYTALRTACGSGTELVFAGFRAGEPTLVRWDFTLAQPLSSFMPLPQPSTTTFYNTFDVDGRFTWAVDQNWVLLAVNGNTWVDPGRLWEVAVQPSNVLATAGHVLSQLGNQTNDQNLKTGDRYFVYFRQ